VICQNCLALLSVDTLAELGPQHFFPIATPAMLYNNARIQAQWCFLANTAPLGGWDGFSHRIRLQPPAFCHPAILKKQMLES